MVYCGSSETRYDEYIDWIMLRTKSLSLAVGALTVPLEALDVGHDSLNFVPKTINIMKEALDTAHETFLVDYDSIAQNVDNVTHALIDNALLEIYNSGDLFYTNDMSDFLIKDVLKAANCTVDETRGSMYTGIRSVSESICEMDDTVKSTEAADDTFCDCDNLIYQSHMVLDTMYETIKTAEEMIERYIEPFHDAVKLFSKEFDDTALDSIKTLIKTFLTSHKSIVDAVKIIGLSFASIGVIIKSITDSAETIS